METVVLGARTLLALACVCGLIWVLARRAGWGKGRRRPAGPTIQVVGRQALGRHAGVAVVAVGERRLLVGFGDQQVTMLTELDPVEVDVDVEVDEHADVEAAGRTAPVLPSGPTGLAGLAALGKKPLVRRRVAQPVTTTSIGMTSTGTTSVSTTPAGTTPVAATTVPIAALPVSAGAHQVEAVDFDAALRGAIALEDTARDRGTPDGTASTATPVAVGTAPTAAATRAATTAATAAAAAQGSLAGSILAPSTWRQALTTLQERTVRR